MVDCTVVQKTLDAFETVNNNQNLKVCSRCRRELDRSKFNKNCQAKDGLNCYCKECYKIIRKERSAKYRENAENLPDGYQKQCCTCKKIKSIDSFYKNRNNNDGHDCYCIECKKENEKKYAVKLAIGKRKRYEKNKEHVSQMGKKRYEEKKDEIKQKVHEYYKKNRDHVIKQKKEYRQNDDVIERSREWHKKYCEEHRDRLTYLRKLNTDRTNMLRRERRKTPEGKRKEQLKDALRYAKKKKYGFRPINKKKEGLVFHHLHLETFNGIDRGIGIYIPAELHRSIWHNGEKMINMETINKAALLWLTEQASI